MKAMTNNDEGSTSKDHETRRLLTQQVLTIATWVLSWQTMMMMGVLSIIVH